MTVRNAMASGKALNHRKPEHHRWVSWGSDSRFEVCACGATRRADFLSSDGQVNPNPCVQMWGPSPVAGATCKTCIHLTSHKQSKTWYKCSLRTDLSHGAKSDQKLRWDACARYDVRPLAGEARRDATDAELDARGAALAAGVAAFKRAFADRAVGSSSSSSSSSEAE